LPKDWQFLHPPWAHLPSRDQRAPGLGSLDFACALSTSVASGQACFLGMRFADIIMCSLKQTSPFERVLDEFVVFLPSSFFSRLRRDSCSVLSADVVSR